MQTLGDLMRGVSPTGFATADYSLFSNTLKLERLDVLRGMERGEIATWFRNGWVDAKHALLNKGSRLSRDPARTAEALYKLLHRN